MDLTTRIKMTLTATATRPRDFAAASIPLHYVFEKTFADGVSAEQADVMFDDFRTLASGANEELDLAGGLTDGFGEAATFARLRAVYIENPSNTSALRVGGAAANAFAGWFADASDIERIEPGGMVLRAAPGAAGWAVTAGTGDLLKFENTGPDELTYRLVLIGASA